VNSHTNATQLSLALSAVYGRIFLGRIHPLSSWLAISICVIDSVCAVVAITIDAPADIVTEARTVTKAGFVVS
jgi:hypothetical protein